MPAIEAGTHASSSQVTIMWVGLLVYCLVPSLVFGQYSWEQLPAEGLSVRLWHTSVCLKDSIVTYGGYNNLNNEALGDLLAYHPLPSEQQWSSLSTVGGPAEGRYGHSASMLGEVMVIVGGQNVTSYLSDVWALDLSTYIFLPSTIVIALTSAPILRWQALVNGKDYRTFPPPALHIALW
jgi:hypothetical protein